ncbi:hypothetical protein FACS1894158_06510 [Betaproteobacteria bacterium]|nr:hypothetical protein FACS1894158_06510 [Betaproteobacteria bacterium]
MQAISGKVTAISPAEPTSAQPKAPLCKIRIGETEALVSKDAAINPGDELVAVLKLNQAAPSTCIAFYNLTQNVASKPDRTERSRGSIVYFILGGFLIPFGIFVAFYTATGFVAIGGGLVILSAGFKLRKINSLLDAEMAKRADNRKS